MSVNLALILGLIYNICAYPFGPEGAKYGFMLLQLLYTAASFIPAYFMYHKYFVNSRLAALVKH